MTPRQAFQEAVRRAGSRYALAKQITVSPQAVYKWAEVPAERVLAVEAATGVSRHELSPSMYPKEKSPAVKGKAA